MRLSRALLLGSVLVLGAAVTASAYTITEVGSLGLDIDGHGMLAPS